MKKKIIGICLMLVFAVMLSGCMEESEERPSWTAVFWLDVDFKSNTFYMYENISEISFYIGFDSFTWEKEYVFYLEGKPNVKYINMHHYEDHFLFLKENDTLFRHFRQECKVNGAEGDILQFELEICIDTDDFFVDEIFELRWIVDNIPDVYNYEGFTVHYFNMEKIDSLDWNVSENYTASIDKIWLKDNFDVATTDFLDGWYNVKVYVRHDSEPWKDYEGYLWYNIYTHDAHIKKTGQFFSP